MNHIDMMLYESRGWFPVIGTMISLAVGLFDILSIVNAVKKWNERQGTKSKIKIIVFIIVFFCITIVSALMVLRAKTLLKVPNVEGKLYKDAKSILIEHNLEFNSIKDCEGKFVIGQTPEAGSIESVGTRVNLVLEEIHVHEWKTIETKEPTCVSEGEKEKNCDCGALEIEIVDELGHTWAEATCTEAKTCQRCKEIEGTELGHKEVLLKGYAATCTTAGLTDGKKCSICGEVTKEQEPIKALGHDEVTMKGYAATCTTTGLTDGKKCSVCGVVTKEQEPINVLGHNEEIVKGYASTCTATGLTDGKQCERCKVMTVAQQIIPAIGHAYSNDTDLDCNNCGYVKGYWSDYGEWSTWQDTSVTGSIYREVGTQDVVAAYNPKTQYKYSRYYGHNGSYWVALEYQSGYCQTYEETEWLDAPMQWSNVWSNQQNRNNDGYGYGVASDGKSAGKKIFWYNEQTQEVDDLNSPIYKTQYRYRDRYIIYY